jgi:hypothetical protein
MQSPYDDQLVVAQGSTTVRRPASCDAWVTGALPSGLTAEPLTAVAALRR